MTREIVAVLVCGACAMGALHAEPREARAAEAPAASDKPIPCRPTIACTADFVPPGTLDLETGALFRRLGVSRQWTFPFLAKLTVARWVQLQVGSNGYSVATGRVPENFFDDLIAGAKIHLHDQTETTPSIAISGAASLPTFRGQLGYVRTYDAFFTGYVSKDVGPVHVDFNVALNVWSIEDMPRAQGVFALALTANMPPPFGVMGEVYSFTDGGPIAPRDGGFLFAFTHSPTSWLVFDLGADVGWFPSARSYSLMLGMSLVPVVFWRAAATEPAQGSETSKQATGSERPRGWTTVEN